MNIGRPTHSGLPEVWSQVFPFPAATLLGAQLEV